MRNTKIFRIAGFTIALLFLVFFAIMLIGEELPNIKSFSLPNELILPVLLWSVCVIALIISFRHPRITGLILILSGFTWFLYLIRSGGKDDIGIALLFGLVFVIPGILFIPWRRH